MENKWMMRLAMKPGLPCIMDPGAIRCKTICGAEIIEGDKKIVPLDFNRGPFCQECIKELDRRDDLAADVYIILEGDFRARKE